MSDNSKTAVVHFTDARNGKPFTHLHYQYTGRDCDGRYDRARVEAPNEGQTLRQMWQWRVRHESTFLHSAGDEYEATLNISDRMHEDYAYDDADDEYGDVSGVFAYPVLSVYKRDEEGYSSSEWSMCSGEHCINDKSTFRDHTAEAAGY